MKSLSLFSGVGGIDLALEQMGIVPTAFCDWEVYCQKVLVARWPGIPVFGDVKDLNVDILSQHDIDANELKIITGGFPCQSHSHAGKRKGKEDERHLWPEMSRLVRSISPDYIIGENVEGLLSSSDGEALGDVLADLADMGYRVGWACFPAGDLGCAHERYRVFSFGLKPEYHGWMPDKTAIANILIGWLAYQRWPALPGYHQRPFEPDRVIFSDPDKDRRARVKAIGNSVTPVQVFPMAVALLCRGQKEYLDFSSITDDWLSACAKTRLFDTKLAVLETCFNLVHSVLNPVPGKVFAHHKDKTWLTGDKPFVGNSGTKVLKWNKWGYLSNKTTCMAFVPSKMPTDALVNQFPLERGNGSYDAVAWQDMNQALWRTPTTEGGVKPENFLDKDGNPPTKLGATIYRKNKDGTIAKQSVTLNQQVEMCDLWEHALWSTPAAYTTAGELPEFLVNSAGQVPKPGEKLYRSDSGRMVQTALTTQVKMWPGETSAPIDDYSYIRTNLWPNPLTGSILESAGCEPGTCKNGLLIDRTAKTDKGKRAMLNPDWEEVLMGFPVGWTKIIHSL